jgi:hypothetical protein
LSFYSELRKHTSDPPKLHVYGDFLKIYDLQLSANLSEIVALQNELSVFIDDTFSIFGSYVLSKAGYFIQDVNDDSGQKLYSTKFSDEDWLNEWGSLIFMDADTGNPRAYYANKKNDQIHIFFINSLFWNKIRFLHDFSIPMISPGDIKEGEINPWKKQNGSFYGFKETAELADEIADTLMEWLVKNEQTLFIINPISESIDREIFLKAKERIKTCASDDILLSTYELINRFIKKSEEQKIVENGWNKLFNKAVSDFKSKYPYIIDCEEKTKIEKIKNNLKNAKAKLNSDNFEDAIRDAGIVCEAILEILGRKQGLTREESKNYEFLLGQLGSYINQEYGKEVHDDLDFIKKWRNSVSHPHEQSPNKNNATQVVRRAELFFELFEKD